MWIQRKNKKIHICIYIIKIDNMQHIYNNTKKKKKKKKKMFFSLVF